MFGRIRGAYDVLNPAVRAALDVEVRLVHSLLPAEPMIIDVGANIGTKTAAFLKAGARVIAIEPESETFRSLEARFGHHARFEGVCAAVGSHRHSAELHVPDGARTMTSLVQGWAPGSHSTVVQVVTLDDLVRDHGVPDYVKIDVEGYEFEVVRGLSTAIGLVSFEYHLDEKRWSPPTRIMSTLERLGAYRYSYRLRHSDELQLSGGWLSSGGLLEPLWSEAEDGRPSSGDVYALLT